MAASVFDSTHLSALFDTGEVGRLFTDTAEIRALLLVEGALAKVQGAQGIIPADSAAFISRAVMELQVDPGGLATATGANGVSIPALIAEFRTQMMSPEHAQYVHWGATSQDIIDTGLMLRLRQALALITADLTRITRTLADLATTHADLPMAARTYGQFATPTSFGALAADWGAPVLDLLREGDGLTKSCLLVSLSGAAGTSGALGPAGADTRAALAAALGLQDPGRSWHTDRSAILRIADWLTRAVLALAKIGTDVSTLMRSGTGEIRLQGAGASSTMPNKQNPVGAELLIALARQQSGLMGVLHQSGIHRDQRDGAAWFTEWMCLPQIVLGAASAARTADKLTTALAPDATRMARALASEGGQIHAEALSFALARQMPRPEAQAAVKALCQEATNSDADLCDLVARDWPDLDASGIFDPARQMGLAPTAARNFAKDVANFTATAG